MLQSLIAGSVRNARAVAFLGLIVALFAAWQVRRMPIDVFPELNAPIVVVLSEAGGFSSLEVERSVTVPIESVVGGLPGVRRVRSGSALSLSLVYVEFDWGVDIYRARQVVGEALDVAREEIPPGVHVEIAPISGVLGEIMLLSLHSADGRVSELELRALGEFEMRRQLLAVPGVAQVVAIGGELPEYQVEARQEDLRLSGVTLAEVATAAAGAHSTAGAGYLADVAGHELPLLQEARVRSVDDIRATVIRAEDGVPIRIGDVADVELGAAPKRGSATIGGGANAVVIGIKKAPFANTLEVTEAIDDALDRFEPTLPAGVVLDRQLFRQSEFIDRSLQNVTHVLRDAAICVAAVLALFLLHLRTTLITLTAIPMSVGLALLALHALGMSLNVMTLGGLAIAIGELVDDAIIDVENVLRRLRGNAALPAAEQRPALRVIIDASNEVRGSVVFATVILIVVFVPLLFLEGLEGRFFRPMGIAYIAGILASLVVAVTLVPALAGLLLRSKKSLGSHGDGAVVRWLKGAYAPIVRRAIQARWAVLGIGAAATLLAGWIASSFGADFLPQFREGTLLVTANAPPGTSLPTSAGVARALGNQLAEIDGVRVAVGRTGRAERDEHAHGPETTEFVVSLKADAEVSAVQAQIDTMLERIPGLSTAVGAPIQHQLSTALSGTKAAVSIDVFGPDLARLRALAAQIGKLLKDIPGVRDVVANREARMEALPIRFDHGELSRIGISPAAAAAQVETAFRGRKVAEVVAPDGARRYELVVRLADDQRRSPADVAGFLIRGAAGEIVRLDEVADLTPTEIPLGVQHENGQRKAVVSLNVAEGFSLSETVAAIDELVTPIVEQNGYVVTFGGQFEAQIAATRRLALLGSMAVVVIAGLLTMAFGSLRAALVVMGNLPLALIGGVVAILLTEGSGLFANIAYAFGFGTDGTGPIVSVASLVGFVTLFGISVRNGVLLVNHYRYLREHEDADLDDAIQRGSLERLAPILMTALTAVLGLLPLALARGEPGSELLAPLATVVLFGLATSTLLNLLVIPAAYRAFCSAPIPSD